MEAEQSSYYREYPVAFGQKREIVGVGQSDTASNTLCRYCFQGTTVFGQTALGAPVFGNCPLFFTCIGIHIEYILFVTQLPRSERWALLHFGGFLTLTCFLFVFSDPVFLGTFVILFSQVLGLSLFFGGFFLYLIMGELVTTEICFFALKSKKEKGTG